MDDAGINQIKRMCEIILGENLGDEELDYLALCVGHHPEILNCRALPPEPRTCETCKVKCPYPYAEPGCPFHVPRSPQSADFETVRDALESLAHAASCGYAMSLKRCNEISGNALAALDRIAGKEE